MSNIEGVNQPSEYIIQNFPDQKLITVKLLGGVQKPGIYRIPIDTSLLTLLTYSGGLTSQADPETLLISGVSQRTVSVKKILHNPSQDFNLKPNETIFIDRKEPLISQDTLVLTTLISSGIGLILSILVASKSL